MYDAIVIGGGPAGSTAASALAMDGRKVVLIEREKLPRYHIGESLLPATVHGVCKLLGVTKEVEQAGFIKKMGGSFRWGRNPDIWTFAFSDQFAVPDADFAYQVERMKFDQILVDNAKRLGVEVLDGTPVVEVLRSERFEGVAIHDASGQRRELRAKYIVDASGGDGLLSQRVGHRHYDEFFRNMALFGYFEGGKRLPAPNSGNILTVAFSGGWFWYIPLRSNLTSVGAVIPKENVELVRNPDRRAALRSLVELCPPIAEMLDGATYSEEAPYDELRILRDFSYTNERFYADGAVLVGDAACFIDPVFSSGVHLATMSGLMAARSINSCLSGELSEEASFGEFERRYRREYGVFYQFLMGFYEIHNDPESYFWNARKLVRTASTNRDAFVRLVSGLAGAEARFSSPEAFARSTEEESRVLEAATHVNAGWSAEADVRDRAAEHIAALTRERQELLGLTAGPVFAGGLIPSASRLRWTEPSRATGEERNASSPEGVSGAALHH